MYIPNPDKKYAVFVIGAGGTGSWLISFLEKESLFNNVVVFDNDIVETKNTLRQNFKQHHVGQSKAEVTALSANMSYVDAYITDTKILHDVMSEFPEDYIPMVVGCLDNNASRKIIHDFMNEISDGVWIDGGNAERHGQAFVAIRENGAYVGKFQSPIDIEPAFQNFDGDERRPDQISCAEQSESAPQNVLANTTSANTLFNLIVIFLHGGAIVSNKYMFNTNLVTLNPHMED